MSAVVLTEDTEVTSNGGFFQTAEGEELDAPEAPWEGGEDGGWEQVGPKNKSQVTRTVSTFKYDYR